jgi:hypothetical protein
VWGRIRLGPVDIFSQTFGLQFFAEALEFPIGC